MNMMPTKFCWGDGENQPRHIMPKSEFTRDARRDDGLCVYCKVCNATRQRAWKHANPDKVRESRRAYRKSQKEQNHGG